MYAIEIVIKFKINFIKFFSHKLMLLFLTIPMFISQFSSVAQSCPTLYDPMNCSTPGHPVHHQLLEFTQTHVHRVSDAVQPSHPLLSPSLPALNLSEHQDLFKWVSSSPLGGQRIDAFELWCWRRLLRVPWTARRSSQSILKEITMGFLWKEWC